MLKKVELIKALIKPRKISTADASTNTKHKAVLGTTNTVRVWLAGFRSRQGNFRKSRTDTSSPTLKRSAWRTWLVTVRCSSRRISPLTVIETWWGTRFPLRSQTRDGTHMHGQDPPDNHLDFSSPEACRSAHFPLLYQIWRNIGPDHQPL